MYDNCFQDSILLVEEKKEKTVVESSNYPREQEEIVIGCSHLGKASLIIDT